MSRNDLRRSWQPWLRGTAIGFPFGAIPAGGAEIPTFLSYVTEKRLQAPEEFGKGAIEGVAGPEAANNASAAGVLVPLLTLGLPTTATAAIMLGAFQRYGIQPGPLLFETQPELVWALIASLFIGNVMLLVLNLPLAPIWAKLLRIPRPYLYAGILFFATLGAYAVNLSRSTCPAAGVGAARLDDAPLRAADRAAHHRGDPRTPKAETTVAAARCRSATAPRSAACSGSPFAIAVYAVIAGNTFHPAGDAAHAPHPAGSHPRQHRRLRERREGITRDRCRIHS